MTIVTAVHASGRRFRHAVVFSVLFAAFTAMVADGAIVPRLEKGEHLNIAAIGTSLTDANFNAQNWFAQAGAWLAAKYPGQVTLSNRAVSGTASVNLPQYNRPYGGTWQLEQVLANDNPDAIFIEFAINDAYKQFNISPAASKSNLHALIGRINTWAAENDKTVDIVVQTTNNTGLSYASSENDTAPYYQAWREEAEESNVLLVDHEPRWVDLYAANRSVWNSYIPDDIHPNTAGVANVILPEVQRVLNHQTPEPGTAFLATIGLLGMLTYAGRTRTRGPRFPTPGKSLLAAACLAIWLSLEAIGAGQVRPSNPPLVRTSFEIPYAMENTPVVFNGQQLLAQNYRPLDPSQQDSGSYLFFRDLLSGQEVGNHFGTGFSFVSAFVDGDQLNVFGTENTNDNWTEDIYRFWTTDLNSWQREKVIARNAGEHLFNTSVCRDPQGYVMAYESNLPLQWSFRFARSTDLTHWTDVPLLGFVDLKDHSTCANPTIRYCGSYYYAIYGMSRTLGPGLQYDYALPETLYVTGIARSKDLATWELSPTQSPMIDPVEGEGINATDADLFEVDGKTYVFYATGDQATWGDIHQLMYDGPMQEMLEAYFPAGVATMKYDAATGQYDDNFTAPLQTPEPSMIVLCATALAGMAAAGRRVAGKRGIRDWTGAAPAVPPESGPVEQTHTQTNPQ